MRNRIFFLIKYALFWLFLFFFARVFFEIYQHAKTGMLSFSEIVGTFLYGVRLDASITGYFVMVVGLLAVASVFVDKRLIRIIINWLTYVLIFAVFFIVFIDVELYSNWGFRMDATPLAYLATPHEALASTPFGVVLGLVLLWLIVSFTFVFLYSKTLSIDILSFNKVKWYASAVVLFFTALFFVPIRGTFTVAPISAGTVYFSNNQYANHAAINVVWNFMDAVLRKRTSKQAVNYMNPTSAKSIVDKMNTSSDSVVVLLNNTRPNVVVVVLESFTSDVVEAFGGLKDVAPNLSRLSHEGVAFSNFYATGSRSDKGLVAILSGYPSQLGTSIMNFPNKTQKLNSLAKVLGEQGYTSAFYYGGDANFANIKSYMLNVGFGQVEDMSSLPAEYPRNSKWGVHDHLMFDYLLKSIDEAKAPFFKVLFTLSSHEPFDVPMEQVISGSDDRSKYLNSVYYTDKSLGAFIDSAKVKPWWSNTLIVFVADHSGRFPFDREIHLPQRYAIPMVWLGGAVDSVRQVSKVGGQQDIPATLLGQMNIKSTSFPYSTNLMDTATVGKAFYLWANGFGLINERGAIAYSVDTKKVFWSQNDTVNLQNQAKALMQIYSTDFTNKELESK